MKVATIVDIPFSTRGFDETIDELTDRIRTQTRTHVVTANPEVVMNAHDKPEFKSILQQAYVVPDGIGIVYAARLLGKPIKERVAGVDLLEALMHRADQHGWKVYLLGGSAEVNSETAKILASRYPGAHIVGNRDGFFSPQQEAEIVAEISRLKPDLLFVALGSPRQDEFIAAHWHAWQVRLAMGVGGSFDVISGKVKRAPKMWQKLHLEWLYRLLSQPSRLRRQVAIPRFLFAVFREKWE